MIPYVKEAKNIPENLEKKISRNDLIIENLRIWLWFFNLEALRQVDWRDILPYFFAYAWR